MGARDTTSQVRIYDYILDSAPPHRHPPGLTRSFMERPPAILCAEKPLVDLERAVGACWSLELPSMATLHRRETRLHQF